METLNKQMIVTYLTSEVMGYRKRCDIANAEGDVRASGDYELRILPLDNLLLQINRGEFDVWSVSRAPDMPTTGEEKTDGE